MRAFSYPAVAVMFLCFILCCSPKQYNTVMIRPASCSHDVQFAECTTLGHLFEYADHMHKPVFLYFCLPWIETCKKMDQYVFTQDELASYFNTHLINYKINVGGASPGPEIADRYGVTTFPTMLFVDGKGKVMRRHEGYATSAQLLEMGYFLHNAVEKELVSLGGR